MRRGMYGVPAVREGVAEKAARSTDDFRISETLD